MIASIEKVVYRNMEKITVGERYSAPEMVSRFRVP